MKIEVKYPHQILDLKGKRLYFDIETDSGEEDSKITMMSFTTEDATRTIVVPVITDEVVLNRVERNILTEILESISVGGHYLQFDLSKVYQEFGVIPEIFDDTFILARMLQEEKNGLKDLFIKFYPKFKDYVNKFIDTVPSRDGRFVYSLKDRNIVMYSGLDTYMLPFLKHKFTQYKQFSKLESMYKVELQFLKTVCKWRAQGLPFDLDLYNKKLSLVKSSFDSELEDFYKKAGRKVKINSPKDVQSLLFDEKGLVPVIMTKKGAPSTNAEALAYFEGDDVVDSLLKCKHDDSVYRASLKVPEFVKDGNIHFKVEQVGYDGTSRIYTKDTSINQLPKELRYCIKAKEGRKFLYFDLSSAELYIAAYWADCKKIVDWYKNGVDLHTEISKSILGRTNITKQEREISKVCSFASIYGSKGDAVSRRLKVSREEGESLVNTYFREFPEIKILRDKFHHLVNRTGYTKTIFDRPRRLAYPGGATEKQERQAFNTAIQGSCADFAKKIMVKAQKYEQQDIYCRFTVFDSFLFDIPESMTEEEIISIIEDLVDFDEELPGFKFRYSYGISNSFGDAQSQA